MVIVMSSNSYRAALAIKFSGFSSRIGSIPLRISWRAAGVQSASLARTPPTNAWIKSCKCSNHRSNNRYSSQTRIRVRRPRLLLRRLLRRKIVQLIERLRWFFNLSADTTKKIKIMRNNKEQSSILFSSLTTPTKLSNNSNNKNNSKISCARGNTSSSSKAAHLMLRWERNNYRRSSPGATRWCRLLLRLLPIRSRLCRLPLFSRKGHRRLWWGEIARVRTIRLLRIGRIALC